MIRHAGLDAPAITVNCGGHGWVHQHVKEAERLGLIVPLGIDPLSTPVRDWQGRWLWLNQDGTATPLTMRETLTIQTEGMTNARE